MKQIGRLLFLLAAALAVACDAGGGVEPGVVMLSPTPAGPVAPALRPVTPAAAGDATPAAPGDTTPVDNAVATVAPDAYPVEVPPAEATVDPFQDEATLIVLGELEADSSALLEFMQSDPDRQAMFGGTYIEHPDGVQIGAAESFNVLQLVASQAEADALQAQLPPLNYPDRLRVDLVTCTDNHLNALMEQPMDALYDSGIYVASSLDTKANRVSFLVHASPDYAVVDGLIDKATLPPDIAAELADPCITVSQGTPVTISPVDPLDGTTWQLIDAPDQATTLAELSPELIPTLAFDAGAFVLTTGCNDPSGAYAVIDETMLTTTFAVSTMIFCDELGDDGMALETALTDALAILSSYAIDGDELRLGYEGGELVWQRVP